MAELTRREEFARAALHGLMAADADLSTYTYEEGAKVILGYADAVLALLDATTFKANPPVDRQWTPLEKEVASSGTSVRSS